VVYDRVTLAKPAYGATFLLHGAGTPDVTGASVRFVAGKSAVVATTLLPPAVSPQIVKEPTNLGDGPYYANEPPEGTTSVRLEVRSPAVDTERRFLHAFVVGPSNAPAPAPARVEGDGVDGVVLDGEAYVFGRAGDQTRPAGLSYRVPANAARHVVVSLAPSARYDVEVTRAGASCAVSIEPGQAKAASSAGTLALEVGPGCALR
jgi:hypothetical protein